MDKFYQQTLIKLEDEIRELEIETDCSVQRIEAVIKLIIKTLSDIKEHILKIGFKNNVEEIHFFKHQKPIIVAKLIYYYAIYKIETKKPNGTKAVKKYFNEELRKLKRHFNNNLELYKYYRTNSTFLDEKLFIRGKFDIKLSIDTIYLETDIRFSTYYDYKIAEIIANDLIQVYLEAKLNKSNQSKTSENPPLKWTASKASATELIYGLYLLGVFNNGNTDIINIVRYFERVFGIDLGDFYHTFMELKSRKINRTKLSDSMREALIKRMDEQDEK